MYGTGSGVLLGLASSSAFAMLRFFAFVRRFVFVMLRLVCVHARVFSFCEACVGPGRLSRSFLFPPFSCLVAECLSWFSLFHLPFACFLLPRSLLDLMVFCFFCLCFFPFACRLSLVFRFRAWGLLAFSSFPCFFPLFFFFLFLLLSPLSSCPLPSPSALSQCRSELMSERLQTQEY